MISSEVAPGSPYGVSVLRANSAGRNQQTNNASLPCVLRRTRCLVYSHVATVSPQNKMSVNESDVGQANHDECYERVRRKKKREKKGSRKIYKLRIRSISSFVGQ